MVLSWKDEFVLGHEAMDTTHREFVALLNRSEEIPDSDFLDFFDSLLEHTRAHFDAELELMKASNFLSRREHEDDHNRIVAEMMQMQRFARRGMIKIARAYIKEKLPDWFGVHAASMDTALALHLK